MEIPQYRIKMLARIFFYLLLFLSSFLIFDYHTVVVAVLFAVFALKFFLKNFQKKNGL